MIKYPFHIELSITNKCNYKCGYCRNSSSPTGNEGKLDINNIRSLILEAKSKVISQITISGGEPLVSKLFKPTIKLLDENNIKWNLNTNGQLINEDIAKFLKKHNVYSVNISAVSLKSEKNKIIRNTNEEFNIIKIINILKKYNINFYFSWLFTNENKNETDALIDFINEHNVKFKLGKVVEIGRAIQNYHLYNDDFDEDIDKLQKNCGQLVAFDDSIYEPSTITCAAGQVSCCIDENGYIYPCPLFYKSEVKIGNIINSTLYDEWNNSEIVTKLNTVKRNNSVCDSCEKVTSCSKGCRAFGFNLTNDYNSIDGRCLK